MIFSNIKLKAIVMLIALFLMCFVFMVVQKNEIEGIAITSTLILAIATLLSACGLYALNYQSINSVAIDTWSRASSYIQGLINSGVDLETRTFDVHNDVYDYIRGYITDTFVVGDNIHSIETQNIVSPWGDTYVYTPYAGTIESTYKTITEEIFNSATKYSQIDYGDFTLKYVYNGLYDILHINNVSYTEYEHDYNKFTEVYYYDEASEQNLYITYSIDYFVGSGYPDPGFSFFYNSTDDKLYPVLLTAAGSYRAHPIRKAPNNQIYFYDTAYPIGEEVEYVIDGSIVLDPDYDFAIDDVRVLPFPYELGEIIGQTAGEVIAETYNDVMTIDRYIELYGSIPVSIDGSFDLPTEGSFDWTRLNMNIELVTDKFPFSIPFDLAEAIGNLVAEPEVPILEQNLTLAGIDGGNLTLDFTPFQPLANIIKWGILIIFNIGLILLTRRIIRG